jgi:hypothetical protein
MTDHLPGAGTPRPARHRRPKARSLGRIVPAIAVLAVGCSPAAGTAPPGSSPGPASTPVPTPTREIVGYQHETGPTDVVLRFEEGGGFVPIEFMATAAPSFTLYGDGTVVFRDSQAIPPEPVGNVMRSVPYLTIRLGEEGIQALIEEGLGPGGLGAAVGPYMGLGADIPTATFTLNINGATKQVSVIGLSPDMHPQDTLIVGSLSRFAEKLRLFGDQVGGEQPYVPAAYRGILIPVDQPFGPIVAWPWPTISPDEFKSGDNEFFQTRVLTPLEVDALGIPGAAGGLQGLALQKDGKVYTFALRPLLPDEAK